MQKKKSILKNYLLFVLLFALLTLLFFWIVKDDWRKTAISTDTLNRDEVLPELTAGSEISQEFEIAADHMHLLKLFVDRKQGAADDGELTVTLSGQDGVFCSRSVRYDEIDGDGTLILYTDDVTWPQKGSKATLTLRAEGGLSFWCGRTRAAGKFQVSTETSGLRLNGELLDRELVLAQQGVNDLPYMDYYWPASGILFAMISAVIWHCYYCSVKNRGNFINKGLYLIKQYEYLLKTLVSRDFKIKYKASVLGFLWSFLNPLLMTFVYMFVFSTLFRSSIENFVVYLMSGIILFNYFSEATNLGMQSIVGNAGLITKVYIPKYIFPVSKVISSGINLVISLIPLLIMMATTGVRFSKSLLLIPVVLVFLILFCVGVGLILSATMVFFRDIQFLWGIFLTILNFLSPIFYPESIIPARFITLYHMNPIYQYLFFMRTITIGGISPTPVTYLYCFLASTITLAVGFLVFRKVQSRFVLYL